jgi:hypothetical protein
MQEWGGRRRFTAEVRFNPGLTDGDKYRRKVYAC